MEHDGLLFGFIWFFVGVIVGLILASIGLRIIINHIKNNERKKR